MAVSLLLHGSEVWVPNKKISTRIQSGELIFKIGTKDCTKLDHIRNEDIKNKLYKNIIKSNDIEVNENDS